MFKNNADEALSAKIEYLKSAVKSIPDYPKPGILFRDVSSLCCDKKAFAMTIDLFFDIFKDQGIDKVVSAEASGFIFGAPLAARLNAGFVMVRKPGKLPREHVQERYDLEYGSNTLQMHTDSIQKGEKVLVLDDLLATGGTVDAMIKLIRQLGGEVCCVAFLIELVDLGGAARIQKDFGVKTVSLLEFPGH